MAKKSFNLNVNVRPYNEQILELAQSNVVKKTNVKIEWTNFFGNSLQEKS